MKTLFLMIYLCFSNLFVSPYKPNKSNQARNISYINVQKSTDFKPQEKRERKTGHACSWGAGGGAECFIEK
jgi:hypothetical protein